MAAERLTKNLTKSVGVPLQWGRDRMAAERTRSSIRCSAAIRFNGAATGWPRNVPPGPGCPIIIAWLQWGRDRMAAERADPRGITMDADQLQWGRDRMAAERCPSTES